MKSDRQLLEEVGEKIKHFEFAPCKCIHCILFRELMLEIKEQLKNPPNDRRGTTVST